MKYKIIIACVFTMLLFFNIFVSASVINEKTIDDVELKYNILSDYDKKPISLELNFVNEFYNDVINSNLLGPLSPPVKVNKKVRETSDDPWADSITAHIGTVLEFQIILKNYKILSRTVVVTDIFPSILDYISGSADPAPDEYFNESEEGMIWLMSIGGLKTKTITFKAKLVGLGYDENYVVVAPLTGEESDDDSVPITSTNNPPNTPNTPDGPTELEPNEEGKYCTSATDSDEDKVRIRFDWDSDGTHEYSDWSNLVASGEEICMYHSWENSGQYKVKAQSKDEFGNTSDWSNGLSVIVNNPPNNPDNPNPSDEATNVDINADLSWECSDPDGDQLTFDVYFEANNPTPDEKVSANQSEKIYNPGTLDGNTNYYWKIIAWDIHGANTEGPVWVFTTENNPPNTPSDPDPNDGQINVEINTDLSWSGGDPDGDDVTYNVFFEEEDSSPDELVSENQSTTTYNPGTLEFSTTYYWQIVSYDSYGASTNGPVWSFTTQANNPPNTPSNPNPSDGATNVDIAIDLSWTGGDPDGDDVFYDVYFGNYSPPPKMVSNQSSTTYDPDIMDYETTYYWQIVSWDEHGASTSGPEWDFTTISEPNDPPNTPSNPNPENGSIDISIELILSWIGGDPDEGDTVVYDVFFEADNPNPDIKVADDISENTFDPGTLNYSTTYYWQIIAKDNHEAITKGPIWHFTTEKEPNKPPEAPTIDGPRQGPAGKELCWTFHSNDEDGDNVKYIIKWGDGSSDETSYYEPFNPIEVCHTYSEQGIYKIKATAEDENGNGGEESTFKVTIPRTRNISSFYLFIQHLLEKLPILGIILELIRVI